MRKIIQLIMFIFIITLIGVSSAWAGEKEIKVSWEQELHSDLAGWNLYHSTDDTVPLEEWELFTEIPYEGEETTTFESTEVLQSSDGEEVTHYFYMTAHDDSGNESDSSNIADIVIDFEAPSSPFGITITVSSQ